MIRIVLGQLRHRLGRAAALFAGIAVATAAFAVLSGASSTRRLRVTGVVARDFRLNYDVLVRPASAQSAVERSGAVVAPNFLSGIFGGISLDQWAAVRHVAGVELAAPIGMVGYIAPEVTQSIDISSALDGSARQAFRVETETVTDRGRTRIPHAPVYVFVTSRRLLFPQGQESVFEDRRRGRGKPVRSCDGT